MFVDKVIYSLGDLINEIMDINNRFGDLIWYRGHADKDWELIPSVLRINRSEAEQYLTNEFYMKASTSLHDKPQPDNYSAWISIMQHFGLPTRLLDWTESPLIAAYFATNQFHDIPNKDACLWLLRPDILNEYEGFNHYIYHMDTKTCLDMIYPAFKKTMSIDERDIVRDKIIATKPVENNMRIYTQQSTFTIHNSKKKLTSLDDNMILGRLIIPKDCIQLINKELEVCGITLSKIYPDAEHIAMELKERTLEE